MLMVPCVRTLPGRKTAGFAGLKQKNDVGVPIENEEEPLPRMTMLLLSPPCPTSTDSDRARREESIGILNVVVR